MIKKFRSLIYNYDFNTIDGKFFRWGKTIDDDPFYAPSPEILDIEISTKCSMGCPECYKSNTSNGKNMSLKAFKNILDKFPKDKNGIYFLTQIAFGIGDIYTNPDILKILKYTRSQGIIPNITISKLNNIIEAFLLARICGAIAVSNHDRQKCYKTVHMLTNTFFNKFGCTLKQVNIHQILSEETYDECFNLLNDSKYKRELKNLNAIVFLQLKPKGRGQNLHPLTNKNKYKKLVDYAINNQIRIGFDSCSAWNFLNSVNNRENYEPMVDPCESCRMSYYINVDGIGFPCSFAENTSEFNGINVLEVKNFNEVWNHSETIKFRNKAIKNLELEKACQIYNLDLK